MKRRTFIAGLGSLAAWPVVVQAQQPAIPVIGFLSVGSENSRESNAAFHRGLSEIGYVDGQNVVVEYRYAENQMDRLPALAADLVRRAKVASASTPGLTGANL
jgi:putative ABC transport system substrate-binding protein